MQEGLDNKQYSNIVLDNNNIPIEHATNYIKSRRETLSNTSSDSRISSANIPLGYEGNTKYDAGVNPMNIGGINDIRANNQSNLDAWGNGVKRLVAKTITDTGESLGYLGGGTAGLFTLDFDKTINNPVVNFFSDLSKQIDQATPIYETSKQANSDLFSMDHLTSAKFWAGDMLGDGGSFLASAWLTGAGAGLALEKAGAKGIGNMLFKAAAGDIEGASTANNILVSQLNSLPKTAAAAVSTYTEGAFEARQTYQDLISSGKTPEEALDGAKRTLMLNMLTIPLSQYQYGSLFKSPNASRSIVKDLFSKTEEGLVSKLAYLSKDFIKTGAEEGLQEGLQEGIQDTAKINAGNKDASYLGDTIDVLKNFATKFSDRNYAESMFQGFLLGAPFGIVEGHKDRKEDRNKLSNLREQYQNRIGDTFKEDIYKTVEDSQGNKTAALNDQGERLVKEATHFYHLEDLKNKALLSNDQESYKFYRDKQFASMAFAKFEAGLGERLQDELTLQGNKSKDEWEAQGLFQFERDENGRELTPKQISEKYKKKALELEKLYNTVQARYGSMPIANSIMSEIFDEATTQKYLKDAIQENTIKRNETKSSKIYNVAQSINDLIYKNNEIENKITALSKRDPSVKSILKHSLKDLKNAIKGEDSIGLASMLYTNKLALKNTFEANKDILKENGYDISDDQDLSHPLGVIDDIDDAEEQEYARKVVELEAALEDSRKRFKSLTDPKILQDALNNAKQKIDEDRKKAEEEVKHQEEEAKQEEVQQEVDNNTQQVEDIKSKPEEEKTHVDAKVEEVNDRDVPFEDSDVPAAPDTSDEAVNEKLEKNLETEEDDSYKTKITNIAHLSLEYNTKTVGKGGVKKSDRHDMNGKPIVSQSNLSLSRPEFALKEDGSFESVVFFVDRDYKEEEKTTDYGNSITAPIAIALKSNPTEKIGYVHTLDWIENNNVAPSALNNILNETKEIRELVLAQREPVEGIITSKSTGYLITVKNSKASNNYGFVNSLTESFGNQDTKKPNHFGESKLVVAKSIAELVDGKNSTAVEKIVNPIEPGAVYMIVPTASKGDYLASHVNIAKVAQSNQANVIAKAIEIHLSNPNKYRVGRHDIATINGLKNFINEITLIGARTKTANKGLKADTFNISIIAKTGEVRIEYGTSSEKIKYKEQLDPSILEGIKATLNYKQFNVVADKLDSKDKHTTFKIEGNDIVQDKEYSNYADFLNQQVLKSNVSPIFTADGKRVLFAQPNVGIGLKSKAQVKEEKKEETQELDPSKMTKEQIAALLGGEIEGFNPADLEKIEAPTELPPTETGRRKFKRRTDESGTINENLSPSFDLNKSIEDHIEKCK